MPLRLGWGGIHASGLGLPSSLYFVSLDCRLNFPEIICEFTKGLWLNKRNAKPGKEVCWQAIKEVQVVRQPVDKTILSELQMAKQLKWLYLGLYGEVSKS